MALSLDEFSKRYQRSGIADPGPLPSILRIVAAYRKAHGDRLPENATILCDWLVRKGMLTPYQVEQLLGASLPKLLVGDVVLRRKLESIPWSGWWMALGAGGEAKLVWPTAQTLSEPARERLRRVINLNSNHLLEIQEQSDSEGGAIVVCNPPEGRNLVELLAERELKSGEVVAIAKQLAGTLEHLHARGLWGALGDPHRVFISESGRAVVLWDPTQDPGAHPGGWFSSAFPPWLFLPPECLLFQQPFDASADIYGLGCLVYYLKFREPPHPLPAGWLADPNAALLDFKQRVQSLPDKLKRTGETTPETEAFNRVLAHCLARNSAARFTSASQMLLAFSAIHPEVEVKKVDQRLAVDKQKATDAQAGSASGNKSGASGETMQPQPVSTRTPREGQLPAEPPANPLDRQTVSPEKQPSIPVENPGRQSIRPAEKTDTTAASSRGLESSGKHGKQAPKPTQTREVKSRGNGPGSPSKKDDSARQRAAEERGPREPKATPGETETSFRRPESNGGQQTEASRERAALEFVSASKPAGSNVPVGQASQSATPGQADVERDLPADGPKGIASAGMLETEAVRLARPVERRDGVGKKRTKRKKKSNYAPLVLGGMGLVVIALLIAVLVGPRGNQGERARRDEIPVPITPPPVRIPGSDTRQGGDAKQVESLERWTEDPRALWAAPPSPPEPLPLRMLPPGADLYVSFRPDRLKESSAAGGSVYEALSPEIDEAFQGIASRIGIGLEDAQRITLGIQGAKNGALQAVIHVKLKESTSREELATLWQAEEANLPGGGKAYVGENLDGDLYLISPQETESVTEFAVGDMDAIKEIAALDGGPIALTRAKSQLWAAVGANPDLAIMGVPNFLFADGKNILGDYAQSLVAPLKQFLIPDTSVYVVRMDFQPQWYMEVRVSPGGGATPDGLRGKFQEAFQGLPSVAEEFLISSSPHPSWKGLAIRLPAMARAVVDSSRFGVVDGNPTINFYLPPEAASNVVLASWLASNTPSSAVAMATLATGGSGETVDGSTAVEVESLLDKTMSISFGQESLEMAAQSIADQFNASVPAGGRKLEIVLLGGDLQLDGITQNQQIRDFDHRDEPLTKVLDDLVRRANPNRTATELYQDAQQLIWVVGPHPERPDSEAILITTRAQAKKKYTIPTQFLPPTP